MKRLTVILTALALAAGAASAADQRDPGDAEFAARSAQLEAARVRLATSPSPLAGTTLIEAENLLRQMRSAPAAKRDLMRTQLDAALTTLEMEIDAAGINRR